MNFLSKNIAGDIKTKKKTKKRKLYELHTWLGFHLAFLMTIVLLTGTIAVISDEIDWLIHPELRVSSGEHKVSWGQMEAAVKLAAPNHMLLSLAAGEAEYFAYRATMLRPDTKAYYLYVNQWTGEIQGTTSTLTVQRFFRDLHRYLFMPNFIGLPIVSSLAVVLIISLYTGLKTVGRMKTAALRMRKNRGSRVLIGDLHKAAGIWSIWFFVVITITALWYFFEFSAALGGTRLEPERPRVTEERIVAFGDVRRDLPSDVLVRKAKAAIPNWEPQQIVYASRPNLPVTILGYTNDFLVRSRANRVFMDPVDGTIIKAQKSEDIDLIAYLNEVADPLHFGAFGLLTTKLIWFVFGVFLTGMSITGVWLTYKRLKSVHISAAQVCTLPFMLVTLVFGYMYVERFIGTEEGSTMLYSTSEEFGDFVIASEWSRGTKTGENHVVVSIRHSAGRPMVQSVIVTTPDGRKYPLSTRTFAENTVLKASLPPSRENDLSHIFIDIVLASGQQKQMQLILRKK